MRATRFSLDDAAKPGVAGGKWGDLSCPIGGRRSCSLLEARYAHARQRAALEMEPALDNFPDSGPFTLDELQDPDFWD